ncbi:hypothetical protein BD410DRAFT_807500 [Rickenella mellea]|uniref:Small ribosomal subunit protein mS41 SAM domain-containing protein n=1 Tax=Rickenella mellea TaxID=50990 RepID=A0A4Y7PQ01_9AGAM|nr:hypothetical protein BD410DRAFT_807500 [Rickenella mellea]
MIPPPTTRIPVISQIQVIILKKVLGLDLCDPQVIGTLCANNDTIYAARIQSAEGFLIAIGCSAESQFNVEVWDEFWKIEGKGMEQMRLAIQDRRYIQWAMEKFREGEELQSS